jgi:hypothetical protein
MAAHITCAEVGGNTPASGILHSGLAPLVPVLPKPKRLYTRRKNAPASAAPEEGGVNDPVPKPKRVSRKKSTPAMDLLPEAIASKNATVAAGGSEGCIVIVPVVPRPKRTYKKRAKVVVCTAAVMCSPSPTHGKIKRQSQRQGRELSGDAVPVIPDLPSSDDIPTNPTHFTPPLIRRRSRNLHSTSVLGYAVRLFDGKEPMGVTTQEPSAVEDNGSHGGSAHLPSSVESPASSDGATSEGLLARRRAVRAGKAHVEDVAANLVDPVVNIHL